MSGPPPIEPSPSVARSTEPAMPAMPAMPSPGSSGPAPPDNLKPNACISCQRRKVKCDRTEPCSSCRRYRAHCEFREPAPRRKRKLSDEDLHSKLDRYEALLNSFGARVDGRPESTPSDRPAAPPLPAPVSTFTPLNAPRPPQTNAAPPPAASPVSATRPQDGRLIFEKGNSRYLENSLWKGITDELRDPREMLQRSSAGQNTKAAATDSSDHYQLDDAELILGIVRGHPTSLRPLHPQPPHIFLLWQAFLDNVNPLVKLLHAQTVQRQILKAATNLDVVDAETEVLMFAIYCFSVTSMNPEECQTMFGESKQKLIARFQYATKLALHRAGFLRSSELVVLQAYILFLLSMRSYYDIHTLWSLTAIAIRMSQRIGLHRDGSKMGLPLFDIEIRRRVWWQVMPLDARTSELAGGGASLLMRLWDTELPLNVNDSELNPDMKQLPVEHAGPTEMFFCLLRYTLGKFMRRSASFKTYFDGDWQKLNSETSIAEKDKNVNELESLLEDKFLKHCDPSIALHYLTAIVARTALSVMRLMAHHPRQYPDKGKTLPQSEKDLLFATSLKIVELDNLAHGDPSLQRFMWHVDAFFQWDGLVYLLSELRNRTTPGEKEIEKAWYQANKCLEFHPDILINTRNPLHIAVATLAVKAWDAYTAEAVRQRKSPPTTENIRAIEVLVARARERAGAEAQRDGMPADTSGGDATATAATKGSDGFHGGQQVTPPTNGGSPWNMPLMQLDSSPMDWELWDDLLQDWGLQGPGGSMADVLG